MALNYLSFIKLPPLKSEQRTARKLIDVSIRKHKAEAKGRAKKAAATGNRRYDKELRLLQKRANERMRQLEIQGIKSPSYKAVQAKLEIMGKQRKGDRGRRFSETGKATYNEAEMQKRILREFLNAKTSTLSGAKDYYDRVWETASNNAANQISEAGITRDQWFDFWENMPDSKKDRMFYSQQVKIFTSFMRLNGELVNEGEVSIEDIVDAIQEAEQLNDVFDNLNDLTGADEEDDNFVDIGDLVDNVPADWL